MSKTKSWLRQLKKDAKSLWDENEALKWIVKPTENVVTTENAKLETERTTEEKIKYENEWYLKTFATRKAMLRHYKEIHEGRPTKKNEDEEKWKCPIEACIKSYKAKECSIR